MSELSGLDASLARKCNSEILRRLASVGQKVVGERIGKSETWVSRWKGEDAGTCADLLAALGLKVVPAEHRCYPAEYIEHLQYFARMGMQERAPVLEWERDE